MMRWATPLLLMAAAGAVGCSFAGKGLGTAVEGGAESDEGDGGLRTDGTSGDRAPDRPVDRPVTVDALVTVDMAPPPPDLRLDVSRLPPGSACGLDGNCASGFCVDGVCCESRCGQLCQGCSKAKTGLDNGLCRPVMAGTDPDGECADDGAMTCKRNGQCNGMGACALYPAGTACGAASCANATLTPPARCSGDGACMPRQAAPCPGNLVCENATACKTRCASNADCTGGLACDTGTGQCRGAAKKANGQVCDGGMNGADCMSGFCVDGVCCESACGGGCRACSSALTGQADGRCVAIPAGMDPQNECTRDDPGSCGRDGTCDGAGGCRRYPDGTTCGSYCCNANGNERRCQLACTGGQCTTQTTMLTEDCDDNVQCTDDKCEASGTAARCTHGNRCGGSRCCCAPVNACVLGPTACANSTCVQ
jgi:hypothetical protein